MFKAIATLIGVVISVTLFLGGTAVKAVEQHKAVQMAQIEAAIGK